MDPRMKKQMNSLDHAERLLCAAALLAAVLALGCVSPVAASDKSTGDTLFSKSASGGGGGAAGVTVAGKGSSGSGAVVVKRIEADSPDQDGESKEITWLGVSTDEVSEVLASQMGLDPGVGLVVTYVATD